MKRLLSHIIVLCAMLCPMVAQAQKAQIKFDQTLHNFEYVAEEGGVVSYEFAFTNTGDAVLLIYDVTTNCGCTVADYPREPIAPGMSGSVVITFDPKGNPGEFAKEIVVKTNAQRKKTKLHIKGVVTP